MQISTETKLQQQLLARPEDLTMLDDHHTIEIEFFSLLLFFRRNILNKYEKKIIFKVEMKWCNT